MFAVGIGYPLGARNNKYLIELNNGICELTLDELTFWLNAEEILNENSSTDNDAVHKLIEIGAVVTGESVLNVFEKISLCRTFRQGAGSIVNHQHALFLGSKTHILTQVQHDIWILSNAVNTVNDIYEHIKMNYKISVVEFIKELFSLIRNEWIFII